MDDNYSGPLQRPVRHNFHERNTLREYTILVNGSESSGHDFTWPTRRPSTHRCADEKSPVGRAELKPEGSEMEVRGRHVKNAPS